MVHATVGEVATEVLYAVLSQLFDLGHALLRRAYDSPLLVDVVQRRGFLSRILTPVLEMVIDLAARC